MKSINSQTNNKSSVNVLTVEFYKHFSNELAPVSLDVYDCWRKLGTMDAISRTEIISAISVLSGDKFFQVIKVAFTNIQFKTKISVFYSTPLPLCEEFATVFHSQCSYTLL